MLEQIKTIGNALADSRAEIKALEEKLAEMKMDKDALQASLIGMLENSGLRSIKTDTHNFAMVTKKDINIIDSEELGKWIKKKDLDDMLYERKLRTVSVKNMAKQMLKTEGEIMPGTEPMETTYISIKQVKND